jgi:hypothetical protein
MSTLQFIPGFRPQNLKVLVERNGASKVVAYESNYMGKDLFSISTIFTRRATPDVWEPGKGLNVPLDQKSALLQALLQYIATQ